MLIALTLLACSGEKENDTSEITEYPREIESTNGTYLLRYTPTPDPIPLNEEFTIELSVYNSQDLDTRLTDIDLEVDAEMPEHGHGMPQQPTVSGENGVFTASGTLFQMSGYWEINAWVSKDNSTEMATFKVDCCE